MIDPLTLLERGNVWFTNFEPVQGHEQGRQRPAVIVSASTFNRSGRGLIAVATITGNLGAVPFSVLVTPPEGGLHMVSRIQCDQIRTIAVTRLLRHLGAMQQETMRQVDNYIRIFFDV